MNEKVRVCPFAATYSETKRQRPQPQPQPRTTSTTRTEPQRTETRCKSGPSCNVAEPRKAQ